MSKSKQNITKKKLKMKGRGLGVSKLAKPKSQESSNEKTNSKPKTLNPILKTSKNFKPKTQKIKYQIDTDKNVKKSASPKTEEELYKSFRKKTLETSLKEEALDYNETLKEKALEYNEDVSTDQNKGIGYMIDPNKYVRHNSIDPDQYVGDQLEQKRQQNKINKKQRANVKHGPNTRLVAFRERIHKEQILNDFKNDYMKNYYLNNPK